MKHIITESGLKKKIYNAIMEATGTNPNAGGYFNGFTLDGLIDICTKLRNGEDVILHVNSQKTAKSLMNTVYDILNPNKQLLLFINPGNYSEFDKQLRNWLHVSDEPNEEAARKCKELENIIFKDGVLLSVGGFVNNDQQFVPSKIGGWTPAEDKEMQFQPQLKDYYKDAKSEIIDLFGEYTYYLVFDTMLNTAYAGTFYVTFNESTHTQKRNNVDELYVVLKEFADKVAHVINANTIYNPHDYKLTTSQYATMLKVFKNGIELVRNGGDPYDGGGLRYCSDKQAYVIGKLLNIPTNEAAKLNRYQASEIFNIKNSNEERCKQDYNMSKDEAFDFYRNYLKSI